MGISIRTEGRRGVCSTNMPLYSPCTHLVAYQYKYIVSCLFRELVHILPLPFLSVDRETMID